MATKASEPLGDLDAPDRQPGQDSIMATKASEPLVHHMIRTIAERPISDATGYVTAEQADAHVSAWVEKGYELMHVSAQPRKFGEHDVEAWVILYVLVKSQ